MPDNLKTFSKWASMITLFSSLVFAVWAADDRYAKKIDLDAKANLSDFEILLYDRFDELRMQHYELEQAEQTEIVKYKLKEMKIRIENMAKRLNKSR